MKFSPQDKIFAHLAIQEAEKTLRHGNYPIGSVLVVNGKAVAKSSNRLRAHQNWASHAEMQLLLAHSREIRNAWLAKKKITLYTTLEPCLMCLGAASLHRVNRIVFSCPDPRGGATMLNPKPLTEFYREHWPKIDGGIFREEVYEMVMSWIQKQKTDRWRKNRKLFEHMHAQWTK